MNFYQNFFQKIKQRPESSEDLKKIFDEDLSKISARFEPKILRGYQNDFNRRSFKDLKKILGRNFMKIFKRKLILIFRIFLEEKILKQNLDKIFLLKIFKRSSVENQRRSFEE